MGDPIMLTPNFSAAEMACPCGKCDGGKMDVKFMARLQSLRNALGPLTVASGFRCAAHNAAVGGEPDSMHLLGRAADIVCPGGNLRYQIVALGISLGFGGLGIAKTYVHLDDRQAMDSQPCRVIWTYPVTK